MRAEAGMGRETGKMWYLGVICFVTTLGGFLFGYDTAVISGGIDSIQAQFGLDADMTGWVVASAIVGCVFGAGISGMVADRFGRKPVLIGCSMLLLISALGCVIARSAGELVVFRVIGGLGVGVTSMASPMYMSETSPARYRGRIVSMYQLAITLGIVCSFLVNALLMRHAGQAGEGSGFLHWIVVEQTWRSMFGMEAIPALAYLLLLGFVPESPRWLLKQGRESDARGVMVRFFSARETERAIGEIEETLAEEGNSIRELFRPGLRAALVLGIGVAVFSQLSGINAVMYFGPTLLKSVGFEVGGAMGGAVLIGVINFVFTFVAIWKIDSFGRRPLLLAGVAGALISLGAAAVFFRSESLPNWLKLAPLLTFCACFSFSYGPVGWVVIGEIFPTRVRGRAVAMVTAALWTGCFLVSRLFPRMLEELGASGTFGVYAGLTAVALVFIYVLLPETRGRTLEEIERDWLGRRGREAAGSGVESLREPVES